MDPSPEIKCNLGIELYLYDQDSCIYELTNAESGVLQMKWDLDMEFTSR